MRSHHLLLLHGQPGSAADWRRVRARLPGRLRAVAIDRPGYGTSRLAAAGFAGNAEAVLAEMDARGIDRAVLVGHSYGGGVALAAASLAPDRVEALVLLASVGPGCLNAVDRLLAAPGTGPACALVAFGVASWGYPRGEHHPLWRTFLAEQRALVREIDQLAAVLPGVRASALLLADPRDIVVPVETSRRLEQSLPGARLRLIRGPGHMLPRRAASRVANAIAGFLASLDSPDGGIGQSPADPRHADPGHAGHARTRHAHPGHDRADDEPTGHGPAGDGSAGRGVSARDPADHGSADHRPG